MQCVSCRGARMESQIDCFSTLRHVRGNRATGRMPGFMVSGEWSVDKIFVYGMI